MLKKIDLNCDMGELHDGQARNFDHEIMPYISSCNIACGFHSGTPAIIEKTISVALQHDKLIGAHPSYNDRANFGRKSIDYNLSILIPELRYQIGAIKGIVESLGGQLNHVKPHGALYNDMVRDANLALAVVQLIKDIDPKLKIYGLAHSQVIDICISEGMKSVNEGFADRRYDAKQKLRSRSLEGAVIHESQEVLEQIENFIQGRVELYNGQFEEINLESICLHSDTKGAVQLSQEIFEFLNKRNIAIGG